MSKIAHQLLDQLMNEVKQNLFTDQIAKIKAEILADVDKKNSDIVQDFVQIADTIHKEIVEDVVKRNKFLEKEVEAEVTKIKNEILDDIATQVHKSVSKEMQQFAEASNAAMDDHMADMRSLHFLDMQRMVKKEIAVQLKQVVKNKQLQGNNEVMLQNKEPVKIPRLRFRRDIFKQPSQDNFPPDNCDESLSLLACVDEEI